MIITADQLFNSLSTVYELSLIVYISLWRGGGKEWCEEGRNGVWEGM